MPADASHNAENETVCLELGDGVVADETGKPSPGHNDHSNSVQVSTLQHDAILAQCMLWLCQSVHHKLQFYQKS